jgi:hypothetical protein
MRASCSNAHRTDFSSPLVGEPLASRKKTPSPLWGEGWGEGSEDKPTKVVRRQTRSAFADCRGTACRAPTHNQSARREARPPRGSAGWLGLYADGFSRHHQNKNEDNHPTKVVPKQNPPSRTDGSAGASPSRVFYPLTHTLSPSIGGEGYKNGRGRPLCRP